MVTVTVVSVDVVSSGLVGKVGVNTGVVSVAGPHVGQEGSALVGIVDSVVSSGLVGRVGVNTGVVSDEPQVGHVGS